MPATFRTPSVAPRLLGGSVMEPTRINPFLQGTGPQFPDGAVAEERELDNVVPCSEEPLPAEMQRPRCGHSQMSMKYKFTMMLGVTPLMIALLVSAAPVAPEATYTDHDQEQQPDVKGKKAPNKLIQIPFEPTKKQQALMDIAKFQAPLLQEDRVTLDTKGFAINVVRPTTEKAAHDIRGSIASIPPVDKEFFTGFQNDNGTGRAITFYVSSNSEVDQAHQALLAKFEAAVAERRTERDALRQRVYFLGLLIAVLAAISAFLTAAFGKKGASWFVVVVAGLTLVTSVLGYISKDRSDSFSSANEGIDKVNVLLAEYFKHRAEHAAVPQEMLDHIAKTSITLAGLE